mmetsp:Transcript_22058/g.21308  ORF Transcript_22058/g.21308 Transcript_22058/m.21308 type:complete len:413 (-) Transcript_22058:266-1504(-)
MSKGTCESFKSATVVALVSVIAFLIVKHVGMQGNFKGNLACFFISTSYVLSLYLIPSNIRKLQRDNPAHIKYRMLAASSSTVISTLICNQFFEFWNFPTDIDFLQACGIRLDSAFNVVSVTCLLMSIFYMGPLLSSFIYFHLSFPQGVNQEGMIRFPKQDGKKTTVLKYILKTVKSYRDDYGDLIIFRNLIFAPISEEVAFRALMIPALYSIYSLSELNKISINTSVLMINSSNSNNDSVRDSILLYIGKYIHISPVFTNFLWCITQFPVLHPESCWKVVLRCPVWFVVAHIHHCAEKIRSGFTVLQALTGTLVQATYTSIFGVIAALLFMRTGSILAPITSHIICNFIGLPNVGFLHQPKSLESSEYSCMFKYRYYLLFAHGLGLVLFSYLILPLTEDLSKKSIYWENVNI